jgi:hypothetical protein
MKPICRNVSIMVVYVLLFFSITTYAQTPSPTVPTVIVQAQSAPKDFWDYLLIAVQIATLIGLVLYVYKTWEIASATRKTTELSQRSTELSQKSIELSQQALEEMRAGRGQEIAPHVIAYIDMPYGGWVLFFVVKNIGRTVAKEIKFDFEPPLQSGWGNRAHEFDVSFLKSGISSLAPGQELRVVFDAMTNYFDGSAVKMLEGTLPSAYTVRVTYRGGLRPDELHASEQVIDLSMFSDIGVLEEKDEKDLIKAVESLAQSNQNIQRSLWKMAESMLKGIWIKNPALLAEPLSVSPQEWKLAALAKVNEFKLLWESVHAGNYERPVAFYIENLQARLSLLSSQLLIVAASAPQGVPGEVTNSLVQVAVKLNVLYEARFLMNGEVSEPDFNATGNETVNLVNAAIEKLNAPIATEEVASIVDAGRSASSSPLDASRLASDGQRTEVEGELSPDGENTADTVPTS